MGTPFITFLEPSKLEGYQRGMPLEAQPPSIPQAFLDAMEVRENVFVQEQGVDAANEFDTDDSKSCHWVVYASVNKTEELEIRDEEGNIVQPRKSSTRTTPIGTIRLVPFPHPPHPEAGGVYYDGQLKEEEGDEKDKSHGEKQRHSSIANIPTFERDRPTSFHDGKEAYVKLGRLAVVKEFRGHRLAGLLVNTVLSWLKSHPSYFDPSITERGLHQIGATSEMDVPKWGGLICVHAQEQVVDAWAKWGFKIDEGMGTWWEEGIKHVGMFQRLDVGPKSA